MHLIDASESSSTAPPPTAPPTAVSGPSEDLSRRRRDPWTAAGRGPGTRVVGGSPATAGAVAAELRRRLSPVAPGPDGADSPDGATAVLTRALRMGIGFKRQDQVFAARARPEDLGCR